LTILYYRVRGET
jgi:hypothetical protein